jgi:hypothetical protein
MQINIEKRHLVVFGLIITGLIAIISTIFVIAYNTPPASYVGHTADEIEGLNLNISQVIDSCTTNGCILSCPSGYIRTGCSGNFDKTQDKPNQWGAYPNDADGCNCVFGRGITGTCYINCIKLG